MSEKMPEKIWAVRGNGVLHSDITATHIENNLYAATGYIRTDLHEALTAERDALKSALEQVLDDLSGGTMKFPGHGVCEEAWDNAVKLIGEDDGDN